MNSSSPSHALDTSFVLRLLTGDPLPQFKVASSFLDDWTDGMPGLAVSDLVVAEAYYALQHHYSFPKGDALKALRALSDHPAMAFSPHARTTLSLPRIASVKPGFVDRLIHGAAQAAGSTLVTFEKAARKLPDVVVLGLV